MFSQAGEERALVNIGGIANLTWLPGDTRAPIIGFDTGPGNTLCDYWINRHRGQDFDRDGDWARGGEVQDELLQDMLANETYFSAKPPKSTGTEYFGPDWLTAFVKRDIDPRDLQATLVELTAATIADALDSLPAPASSVFVCGGGAHNVYLLQRLQRRLPQCRVDTTASLGLDPDFVEAAAFAWLARERIEQRPGNVPEVTNAEREAILGGVYSPD